MKTIRNIFLKALAAGVAFTGCSEEVEILNPDVKEVTFSINVPGKLDPSVRALGDDEENEIKTIEMLIFDPVTKGVAHNPVFADVIVTDPDSDGNFRKKSFLVRLPPGTFDAMIFANSRGAFNSVTIQVGELQDVVLAKLKIAMPTDGWVSDPNNAAKHYLIPMWGMKEGVLISSGTTISDIYFHRILSRIDVSVTGDDAQTGSFKIKDIKLYNVQKEGRVAPILSNWNKSGMVNGTIPAGLATAPSLTSGGTHAAPISYASGISLDKKSCVNKIYLFEAPKATTHADQNAPFLTVKGEFDGVDGWYRIDFANYQNMSYYDILRNHLYQISIKSVAGTGFPNEEDAKKNRRDNITVDITPWNVYDLDDTWFPGQNHLFITPQDVRYNWNAHTGKTIAIVTDVDSTMTIANNIKLSDSNNNPNAGFTGDWIANVSLSPKSVVNGKNYYTLTYDVTENTNAERTGYIYITIGRVTSIVRIVQDVTGITATPSPIWLSPSLGNGARMVQVTATGPWTVLTTPSNAILSVASGSAGVTNVTITRRSDSFGLADLVVQNTQTGETATVNIDNYHIVEDEEYLLPSNNPVNTATYDVYVYGGSEKFTIEEHSSWITSATILPGNKLQLTAGEALGGSRTGYITLAHASDPEYKVTIPIRQSASVIPPFKFFVMNFTWAITAGGGDDADIAVEFVGNNAPFDTNPYIPHNSNNYSATNRAMGFGLKSMVAMNGNTELSNYKDISGGAMTPAFTQGELQHNLMFWGGDATSGSVGETVFFNAPMITPADPTNDNSGLPRYIKLNVYVTWFSSSGAQDKRGNPVRLTISTYNDGVMNKPLTINAPIYRSNFYNLADYSTPITTGNINAPGWSTNRSNTVNTRVVGAGSGQQSKYREDYQLIATIIYDRYRRNAEVTWHAPLYTGGINPPLSFP